MCSTGLLVWLLSSSLDLAILYLHRCRPDAACEVEFFTYREVAALTMLDWLHQDHMYHELLTGVDSIANPYRQLADRFLIDSMVVEYIVRKNGQGLTVDLAQTILVLLRLWSHRSRSQRVDRWLRKLVWHRNTRRHYGVWLRRNFMLCITAFPLQRELAEHQITERVFKEGHHLGP